MKAGACSCLDGYDEGWRGWGEDPLSRPEWESMKGRGEAEKGGGKLGIDTGPWDCERPPTGLPADDITSEREGSDWRGGAASAGSEARRGSTGEIMSGMLGGAGALG